MRTWWLSLALTGCLLSADDYDHDDDGDGIPASEDCDDGDASRPLDDADCDGVRTAADCDDEDASRPLDDADCDGVPTVDDCDDGDAVLGAQAEDDDCDGVRTANDCDDSNPSLPESLDDLDCDDVPIHAGGGSLLRISAGSFNMGCTSGQSDCDSDESPVMPVTLTHDYYMGVTEVTQAEYEAVMGTNPSTFTDCGTDCPVESVSWHEAAAYANALSSSAGLMECYTCSGSGEDVTCAVGMSPYDCDGYRLPTEAEWEGAARCGEDLMYAGSDESDAVGWTSENSGGTTHPVAGKEANACGLYDMSGNVWEWTQDGYADDYTSDGRTDPVGDPTSSLRVIRGGSWYTTPRLARVANRDRLTPDVRDHDLGLRLVRTIP